MTHAAIKPNNFFSQKINNPSNFGNIAQTAVSSGIGININDASIFGDKSTGIRNRTASSTVNTGNGSVDLAQANAGVAGGTRGAAAADGRSGIVGVPGGGASAGGAGCGCGSPGCSGGGASGAGDKAGTAGGDASSVASNDNWGAAGGVQAGDLQVASSQVESKEPSLV